jgi:hypothetical protein
MTPLSDSQSKNRPFLKPFVTPLYWHQTPSQWALERQLSRSVRVRNVTKVTPIRPLLMLSRNFDTFIQEISTQPAEFIVSALYSLLDDDGQ